jgi:hypothetical protein
MYDTHPRSGGCESDLRFYLGMTRDYIERYKISTGKYYNRDIWLIYAQRTLEAAETKLEQLEEACNG